MRTLAFFGLLTCCLCALGARAEESTPQARNTTTGKDFEKIVKRALIHGGYQVEEQVPVGQRPNGSKHLIDLVAKRGDEAFLISLKWQQSAGTAEQKVPYEVICLSKALEQSKEQYDKAYLVLGGDGWTLKEFYLGPELAKHLKLERPVQVTSLEAFIFQASKKTL
ncbi:MAG: hypothetical protein Q7Q71_12615 [Verrucomicrobiota bacterium JB023]|nr:hypothetical protein [Verrucomicrobiota bacterium JB023]